MAPKQKKRNLDLKKGLSIFALCWIATVPAVFLLRQAFIPREELDCYKRVAVMQKAVDLWNGAHPDKALTDEIDEAALVKEGFLAPLTYDHDRHYYFVGQTAHGPRVKCNKDEDNPLILRLTGDTLLAVILFFMVCFFRGYVLFDPA